jgi:hypothetical protein
VATLNAYAETSAEFKLFEGQCLSYCREAALRALLSMRQQRADAVEKLDGDFELVFTLRAFSTRARRFEQPPDWFSQPIGAD